MKFCILDSYCSVGRITRELLLTAFTIIALFLLSLDWMAFMVWVSWCVCVCVPWTRCLCLWSVSTRSATCFLQKLRSDGGPLK
jgi:hypothetical protein